MNDSVDFLDFRILIEILVAPKYKITMVQLAQKLGEKKYTITRAMDRLECNGLIARDGRLPVLTEAGKAQVERYQERYLISRNHMLYEGTPVNVQTRMRSTGQCIAQI